VIFAKKTFIDLMLGGYAVVDNVDTFARLGLERLMDADELPGVATEAVVVLSPTDQVLFANALLSPPPSAPALKRALAARRTMLREL
jgi:hypothetical protein